MGSPSCMPVRASSWRHATGVCTCSTAAHGLNPPAPRLAAGTFNALIEQEGLAPKEPDRALSPPQTPRSPQWRLGGFGSGQLAGPGASSSGGGSRWRFWRRRSSPNEADVGTSMPQADRQRVNGELRHGTALFELPSAFSVTQVGQHSACDGCVVGSWQEVVRLACGLQAGWNSGCRLAGCLACCHPACAAATMRHGCRR